MHSLLAHTNYVSVMQLQLAGRWYTRLTSFCL